MQAELTGLAIVVRHAGPGVDVRTDADVVIRWPSWALWRFAQRCPELIGFRDTADVPPVRAPHKP